jgi:hypothetical protein
VSGVVVDVTHVDSAPVAAVVQPAGSAGAVTPSKFSSQPDTGVPVAVGVAVAVAVGVFVGVPVGVLVAVAVGVLVGVLVAVAVGVADGVLVGVPVTVGVAVGVFVGVAVGVFVGVLVGVLVGVGVWHIPPPDPNLVSGLNAENAPVVPFTVFDWYVASVLPAGRFVQYTVGAPIGVGRVASVVWYSNNTVTARPGT